MNDEDLMEYLENNEDKVKTWIFIFVVILGIIVLWVKI